MEETGTMGVERRGRILIHDGDGFMRQGLVHVRAAFAAIVACALAALVVLGVAAPALASESVSGGESPKITVDLSFRQAVIDVDGNTVTLDEDERWCVSYAMTCGEECVYPTLQYPDGEDLVVLSVALEKGKTYTLTGTLGESLTDKEYSGRPVLEIVIDAEGNVTCNNLGEHASFESVSVSTADVVDVPNENASTDNGSTDDFSTNPNAGISTYEQAVEQIEITLLKKNAYSADFSDDSAYTPDVNSSYTVRSYETDVNGEKLTTPARNIYNESWDFVSERSFVDVGRVDLLMYGDDEAWYGVYDSNDVLVLGFRTHTDLDEYTTVVRTVQAENNTLWNWVKDSWGQSTFIQYSYMELPIGSEIGGGTYALYQQTDVDDSGSPILTKVGGDAKMPESSDGSEYVTTPFRITEQGTYFIEETTAPEGCLLNKNVLAFKLVWDEEEQRLVGSASTYVYNAEGKLTLKDGSAWVGGTTDDGSAYLFSHDTTTDASFKVRLLDDEGETLDKYAYGYSSYAIRPADDTSLASSALSGATEFDFETGVGTVSAPALEVGKVYYLYEAFSPMGYLRNDGVLYFYINPVGEVVYCDKDGKATTDLPNGWTVGDDVFNTTHTPFALKICKTDSNGAPLVGAKFSLETKTLARVAGTIENLGEGDYIVTDEDGCVAVEARLGEPGGDSYSFVLEEVEAPEGYGLATWRINFKVNSATGEVTINYLSSGEGDDTEFLEDVGQYAATGWSVAKGVVTLQDEADEKPGEPEEETPKPDDKKSEPDDKKSEPDDKKSEPDDKKSEPDDGTPGPDNETPGKSEAPTTSKVPETPTEPSDGIPATPIISEVPEAPAAEALETPAVLEVSETPVVPEAPTTPAAAEQPKAAEVAKTADATSYVPTAALAFGAAALIAGSALLLRAARRRA